MANRMQFAAEVNSLPMLWNMLAMPMYRFMVVITLAAMLTGLKRCGGGLPWRRRE
jgi:hypothetical protein